MFEIPTVMYAPLAKREHLQDISRYKNKTLKNKMYVHLGTWY